MAKMVKNRSKVHYDTVVCGGGPAGIAAAAASAKSGCRTILIERFGRLGGMGTNGLVNQFKVPENPPGVAELFSSVSGRENDCELLDVAYAEMVSGSGAELLLHSPVCDVITEQCGDITVLTGVRVGTFSGFLDIIGERFVDATGDGTVAFLSGAEFEIGRESDSLVQPATIMFRVSGVDHSRSMEANGGRGQYRFPEGSWDHVTMAACRRGELPPNVGKVRTYMAERKEDRYVNATQVNSIDGTDAFDLTRAEIEGRRQVPVIMAFLKKHAPGFETAFVSRMPATIGIRETRRFRGMAYLTREDCMKGRRWPDAVVTGCRKPLDVHNPVGPGQAGKVSADHPAGKDPRPRPYDIPYRALVPKDTDGLLLAGRCISGDHHAHASYRFQRICMATGAAAGYAAAESLSQNVQPRSLDVKPVQNMLGLDGRKKRCDSGDIQQ